MIYIRLNKIFPFLLLTFPVIVDIINGYLKGTDGSGDSLLGILYRGIIILFSCFYLFRTRYSNYIKVLLLSAVFLSVYQLIIGGFSSRTFMMLIKILNFYFVISLLLGCKYFSSYTQVVRSAIWYGVIAAFILIYCFVFKVGYGSYTDETFGTKGFFVAMNDVELTILLLNILACYSFQKTKNNNYLLASLVMSGGACLVGSMACFFGTAFILLSFAISVLFMDFEDYKSSRTLKIIVVLFLFVIFNFLVIKIITIIQEDSFLSRKYADIMEVFLSASGKDRLIDAAVRTIGNFNVFDWFFGKGNLFLIENQRYLHFEAPKEAEVDPIDLIGQSGIIFSFFILYIPIKKLFSCIKGFFKKHNILDYWSVIALFMFIGHACYGGHAYTSPLVLSYLAVFIYLIDNKNKINIS